MQSLRAKRSKNYPAARMHGRNALILIVLNIIFTLCVGVAVIAWITEYACISSNFYGQNGELLYYFYNTEFINLAILVSYTSKAPLDKI